MVRNLALALAIVGMLGADARADAVAELEAKGAAQAKDGRYTDAIDTFKQADRFIPRAGHACLIALAYTRRELWSQAELFFAVCHERARAGDPLPDWLPTAEKQLAERLATAKVALVELAIEPATARFTVSSFAPDEVFEAHRLHLTFGTHLLTITADGYEPALQSITIDGKADQRLAIKLRPRLGREPAPAPPPASPSREGRLPWLVMGAGGALVATAAIYHVTALKSSYDRLHDATDPRAYDAESSRYDRRRAITIALYAAGGVALGTGYYLHRRWHVAVEPQPGGAVVGLEWRR